MSVCVITEINFYGEDSVLDRLESLIKEWRSKKYCENDWDKGYESDFIWLGNIVGNSGIDDRSKGDFSVACRGYICDIFRISGKLGVMQETKNQTAVKMWQMIVEKYDLNLEIKYWSDSDSSYYATNDPDYENRCIVDCANGELYGEFSEFDDEVNKEDLITKLQRLLSSALNTVAELAEELEERYDDIWVHEWDFVPLSECT